MPERRDNINDGRQRSLEESANEIFEKASIHKVAEIIYHGLGTKYIDARKEARKKYEESMSLRYFNVDLNQDAVLSAEEKQITTRFMSR